MPFWLLDSNILSKNYLNTKMGEENSSWKDLPERKSLEHSEKLLKSVMRVPIKSTFCTVIDVMAYRKLYYETWYTSLPRSIFSLNYTKRKSYWHLMRYNAFFGGFFSHHVPYTADNECESFINGFSFFSLSGKRGWVFCSNEFYPIRHPHVLNTRFKALFARIDAGVLGSYYGTQMFEQYRPLDKFYQPRNFARSYKSRLTNHLLVGGRERTEEFFAKFYEQTRMSPVIHIRDGASAATGRSRIVFCKANFELTYNFKYLSMSDTLKKNVVKGSFINSEFASIYHAFANKAFIDRIAHHFDGFNDYFIRMASRIKKFPKNKWRRRRMAGGFMASPSAPLWAVEMTKNIFRRSFFGADRSSDYLGGRVAFDMLPHVKTAASSLPRALQRFNYYFESLSNSKVPLTLPGLTRRFVNSASLSASNPRWLATATGSRRRALIKKLFSWKKVKLARNLSKAFSGFPAGRSIRQVLFPSFLGRRARDFSSPDHGLSSLWKEKIFVKKKRGYRVGKAKGFVYPTKRLKSPRRIRMAYITKS